GRQPRCRDRSDGGGAAHQSGRRGRAGKVPPHGDGVLDARDRAAARQGPAAGVLLGRAPRERCGPARLGPAGPPTAAVAARLAFVPSIHRATHRIGLYLAALREDGLSQGEAHILADLATSSPATIKDLHRGLAHKRSTLTSILDRLVDRGLITREVGPAD